MKPHLILLILLANSFLSYGQDRNQILLIGTAHEFNPALRGKQDFESIINKVVKFEPTHIFIESIPTWDTVSLQKVRQTQLRKARKLRLDMGLKSVQQDSVIRSLFIKLDHDRNDLLTRSTLGNYLYASHDFWNAYFHWYFLSRQIQSDSCLATPALRSTFAKDSLRERSYVREEKSEFGNLIFPLAEKLSINYLYGIDDRADDDQFQKLGKHALKRLLFNGRIFKARRTYLDLKRKTEMAEQNGQLIEEINSMAFQNEITTLIQAFPDEWVKSKKARQLQLTWYQRNERMAQRISSTVKSTGATKTVVFFGAAHVGFIRQALEKDPDFEVILFSQL